MLSSEKMKVTLATPPIFRMASGGAIPAMRAMARWKTGTRRRPLSAGRDHPPRAGSMNDLDPGRPRQRRPVAELHRSAPGPGDANTVWP